MEGRLLLDVVVRKSAAILELLAGEDETLLVRGNALLVCCELDTGTQTCASAELVHTLDLGLHIVDGVRRLHLKGDSLARTASMLVLCELFQGGARRVLQGLHEDLHGGLSNRVVIAFLSVMQKGCEKKSRRASA